MATPLGSALTRAAPIIMAPIYALVVSAAYAAPHQQVPTQQSQLPDTIRAWWQYSDEEKDGLRVRWTEELIEEIVDSLNAHGPLPVDYVRVEVVLDGTRERRQGMSSEWLDWMRGEYPSRQYDLRGISFAKRDLDSVDLRGAHLEVANLHGARLNGANLEYATLREANLDSARLGGANLRRANLRKATLRGATMWSANLQEALLWEADLDGAWLIDTDLMGAQLEDFDALSAGHLFGIPSEEMLYPASLRETNLFGANLQGVSLVGVDLTDANLFEARFGDTPVAVDQLAKAENYRYLRAATGDIARSWGDLLETVETYHRDTKHFFRREQMGEMAAEYHYWENEARTARAPWYEKIARLTLLKWSFGYGSRPMWILRSAAVIVVTFGIIFSVITLPRRRKSGIYLVLREDDRTKEELLSWRKGRLVPDCLYFSLLSFATFGYGALRPRQWIELFRLEPVEYKAVGWARIMVAVEAALGIYLFALLATVLFGKA